MFSHFKAAAIFTAAALILAMPLAAQNATEELGALESNMYKATSGLFGNDVDNFVDVHSYGDVLPEGAKWFGFITGRPLTVGGQESIGWLKPEGVEWDANASDGSGGWGAYKDPKGYLPDNPTTGLLSLGYARQVGGIYLGLWYQGNIAQITGGFNDADNKNVTKTSKIVPTYDDPTKTVTQTVTTTTWNESWLNASNQIEVLVGVAGQGVKLGFYESLFSNVHKGAAWRLGKDLDNGQGKDRDSSDDYKLIAPESKKTDYKNGIVDYEGATDEFYTKGGYLKPYLGWGTSLSVGGFGLRPYVNLGATFKSDSKVDNYSDYTTANGKKYAISSSIDSGYDFSYMKPEIGVGAWVDFAAKEGKTAAATVGIEYNLGVYLYNSSYAPTGISGDNVKGTVAWPGVWTGSPATRGPGTIKKTTTLASTTTKTDINLNIDEINEVQHAITPTYIISGDPVENFSLGFQASAPVGIRTYTSEKHSELYDISETKYNTDTQRNTKSVTITRSQFQSMQETELNIDLDLAIGASYKLIPNRFTINAGISAKPVAFTNTVTTYKAVANKSIKTTKVTDGLGNVTENTKTVTLMDGSNYDDSLIQDDQVESNTTWDGFSGNVTGGFTFFFTQNIALDLAASWGKDSFNADIADVNVLFSFKF